MTITPTPDKPEPSSAKTVRLGSPAATRHLAAALSALVRPGDVIALQGSLGAGKTAFARAFIQNRQAAHGLAVEEVPSPTFTLVQTYDFPDLTVWHFDFYRLSAPEEAVELGFEEAALGVALIEWPERIATLLPDDRLDLLLDFGDENEARIATLRGSPSWRVRLAGLELP